MFGEVERHPGAGCWAYRLAIPVHCQPLAVPAADATVTPSILGIKPGGTARAQGEPTRPPASGTRTGRP